MKINEVLEPSEQSLYEAIDAEDDTEFSTDDLVGIIKSANGPWSTPMTGDEFSEHLTQMAEQYGGTTN